MAKAHRLVRAIAGTGLGPKKGKYRIPASCRPSADDWKDAMKKPADEGGMKGTIIENYEEDHERIIAEETFPELLSVDMNLINQMEEDYRGTRRVLLTSPGRKATPEWSVPIEIWKMILAPDWLPKKGAMPGGVGSAYRNPSEWKCPTTQTRIKKVLLQTRRAMRAPMNANKSKSFQLDKKNG